MTPRAPALPRDERRAALIEATLPLLREKGRAVSTKDIAAAAGVAEGTIFGVFDTKEQLVDEAIHCAFAPGPVLEQLAAVSPDQPLQDRLVAATRILQDRFVGIFTMMAALGMLQPPDRPTGGARAHHLGHRAAADHAGPQSWRGHALGLIVALIEPDRDRLRVTPEELARLLRLLTFAGSHRHIADDRLLTPQQVVDVLLHGTLAADDDRRTP